MTWDEILRFFVFVSGCTLIIGAAAIGATWLVKTLGLA